MALPHERGGEDGSPGGVDLEVGEETAGEDVDGEELAGIGAQGRWGGMGAGEGCQGRVG